MITVLITFSVPENTTLEKIKEKFCETAPMYQDVPGLIRKNYLFSDGPMKAGGAYTFSDREKAEAWFDEDRLAWIENRYSKPEIMYFETPVVVNNEQSKIEIP